MCIVNGRIGQDKGIGQFTFQGTQGSSLIDYVLLSPDLMDKISVLLFMTSLLFQTIHLLKFHSRQIISLPVLMRKVKLRN